jgi:hypothetical protein
MKKMQMTPHLVNRRLSLRFSILLQAAFLLAGTQVHAQKAYPVELLGLLGKLPIPESAALCYGGSTTKTDPSNGSVSIVNTDPAFKELNDELDRINKAAMDGMKTPATPQPPTQEQVQQMQQQAMQQASSMQGMSPQQMAAAQQAKSQSGAPSKDELLVLQQLGKAQNAAGLINQLVSEMGQKFSKLDKSPIDKVSAGGNCPEVQQGGYAGPTCDCLKGRDQAYQTKRVAAYNSYLSEVKGVINDYLGQIKAQSAIVDNFEHAAKYGDVFSNPMYKQLAVQVQRQAMGGFVALLGACSGNWEDAAKMQANLVNAISGASVGCAGHK